MNLKVISFNIRCCNDPEGNSIKERAPRLVEITTRYDADIIGFQEYRPAWEKFIKKYYSKKYDIFCKYRNETVDIEASPILWRKDRFKLVSKGYFWLSDTPEKESRGWDEVYNCYRMCVYVTLQDKKTKKTFTVMNTHFGFGDKGQVASARLIYEYRNKISNYPAFIVGDFNMTPDSVGYKEMVSNFDDVNVLTSNDMRSTFHNYDPEVKRDLHIDYCFIDKCGIVAVSQKIITDTVDGKFPSDHFGLYIVLEI